MVKAAYDSGINIIIFLQSLGNGLSTPMQFFTFLGQEEFYILLMPILYWSVNVVLGLRVGILLMLSNGFVSVLQLAFHSPRPFWYSSQVRALTEEMYFGMPSGHAMNAVSVWGLIAVSMRRTWSLVLLILLIFLIGFSRVVLGVHFPIDVVAGWLFGMLLLWLFLLLEAPILAWFSRHSLATQVLIAFSVSLAYILVAALIKMSLADFQFPAGWVENATVNLQGLFDPFSLARIITTGGVLFGFASGAFWLYGRGGYEASGSVRDRLLRYPVGLVGVLILWYGLGLVFPEGEYLGAYVLRYIRYFLIGIWVTALAPILFIRLGLAGERTMDDITLL